MDISSSKQVMLRTHMAALTNNSRASAIELSSAPGIGKSESVGQMCGDLAVAINEPVGMVTLMLATVSSVDVRGFMLPIKKVNAPGMDTVFSTPPWYPVHANVTIFMPDGTTYTPGTYPLDRTIPRVGVVFLDEFGQAEDDTKKAAAELLLHGCVGTTTLPPGWRVIAASNRMGDRSGVVRALTFIVNRRLEIKVEARLPPWLAYQNALPPEARAHFMTLSFAQQNPTLVFRDEVPPGSNPFCTPRTLCLMDRDLRALRSPEDIAKDRLPLDSISREVARGWIGEAEAAQFYVHLKYSDEIPTMDSIVKDPMRAKLPPNKDAQMVVAYFLAHNVDEKNATSVMMYLERLLIDMQVLAVRAVTAQQSRAKLIINTVAFSRWLQKHQTLLIASRA